MRGGLATFLLATALVACGTAGDGIAGAGPPPARDGGQADGAAAVGAPCTTGADCAGAPGLCATEADGFEDGLCTRACDPQDPCPAGSHCAFQVAGAGACLPGCATGADCRGGAGYACLDADGDGRRECWPAATGTGAVGDPCAHRWDCAGGPAGYCAAPPAWPGGCCVLACDPVAAPCPPASLCVAFDPRVPGDAYCLAACATGADCRAGYQCAVVDAGGAEACLPP